MVIPTTSGYDVKIKLDQLHSKQAVNASNVQDDVFCSCYAVSSAVTQLCYYVSS